MIGVFLRQWRRVLVGAILLEVFLILGVLVGLGVPLEGGGPFGTLVAATIIVVLAIPAAMALILAVLRPGALSLIEWLGLSLVLGALTAPLLVLVELPALVICLHVGLVMLASHWLLGGAWQARFAGPGRPRTARFRVPLPPEEVRQGLRPDPNRPEGHYWPGTRFLPPPPGSDADFVMVRPRRGGLRDETWLTTVEDHADGYGFSLMLRPVSDGVDPHATLDFAIAPRPRGTEVRVRQTVLRARPGQHLFWWLGSDLRDHCASMHARLTGRRDLSMHGRQMPRA